MKSALVCVFIGFLGTSQAEELDHPTSEDLILCPEGHEDLKDIPVVYGLVAPLWKEPDDYNEEDHALIAKQERGEVFLGGDALIGDPPDSYAVCQTCDFRFTSDPLEEGMGTWIKAAKNLEDFQRPMCAEIQDFPKLEAIPDSEELVQFLSADKTLFLESFRYDSRLRPAKLASRLRQWMEQNEMDSTLLRRWKRNFHLDPFAGETREPAPEDDEKSPFGAVVDSGGRRLKIEVEKRGTDGSRVYVTIDPTEAHTEKIR